MYLFGFSLYNKILGLSERKEEHRDSAKDGMF